jgi:Protein of unknown function (DUF3122)
MKIIFQRLRCCILVLLLVVCSTTIFSDSANALLRFHQDTPGVMHYHSEESIKDDAGHAWQVVLFKVFKSEKSINTHLRLVAFPGVAEFAHPRGLEVITKEGKLLVADDIYGKIAPAPNVGEYDLTYILTQLKTIDSLELYLPLIEEKYLSLKIPQALVSEWQILVTDVNR